MGFLDCDERTVREKRTFSTVMCFKHSRGGKKNTASDRNLLVSPLPGGIQAAVTVQLRFCGGISAQRIVFTSTMFIRCIWNLSLFTLLLYLILIMHLGFQSESYEKLTFIEILILSPESCIVRK